LLLAACGDGGSPSDGIASLEGQTTTAADDRDAVLDAEESILALVECMRVEGVDIPDPEFDDRGNLRLVSLADLGEAVEAVDPDDLEAAVEACEQYLVGVAQVFQSIDRTAIEDRLVEFAACMREQGFDLPDPDFSGGFPGEGDGPPQGGPFGDIDTDDPAFQRAYDACLYVFGETIGVGGFGPAVDDGG